ncbi:unnamed protein product [Heligmosomoides polygyrus]|uniref:FHA domain-containing protein n=1 Tax=Heligmosomoides polygyrus TaxID=6339 RepID=A0A183FUE9_HELPZ|nr:unnamed protein product [Heligmosomoides polygyrus]
MNARTGLILRLLPPPRTVVSGRPLFVISLDVAEAGVSRYHCSPEERRAELEEDLPWHGRQEEVTAGARRGAPSRGHTPQAGPRRTLASCCWGFP